MWGMLYPEALAQSDERCAYIRASAVWNSGICSIGPLNPFRLQCYSKKPQRATVFFLHLFEPKCFIRWDFLKLLPVPNRQHCPPTLTQKKHSAAWIFSLAITASDWQENSFCLGDKKKKRKDKKRNIFAFPPGCVKSGTGWHGITS